MEILTHCCIMASLASCSCRKRRVRGIVQINDTTDGGSNTEMKRYDERKQDETDEHMHTTPL